MHPAADRLFSLIKQAKPEYGTPSTRDLIAEITKAGLSYKEFKSAPIRLNANLRPHQLIFNHTISTVLF